MNSVIVENILSSNSELLKGIVNLLKDIFSGCIKNNTYFEKIIFTGVFDSLKKEVGTGMNNVKVYGMMSAQFKEDFGFLQSEVDELIIKLGLG